MQHRAAILSLCGGVEPELEHQLDRGGVARPTRVGQDALVLGGQHVEQLRRFTQQLFRFGGAPTAARGEEPVLGAGEAA